MHGHYVDVRIRACLDLCERGCVRAQYYTATKEYVLSRGAEAERLMRPLPNRCLLIVASERTAFFETVYHLSADESSDQQPSGGWRQMPTRSGCVSQYLHT